jgi:hypothetical protein
MACRLGGKLHTPAGEQSIGADENRVGPLTHEICEGHVDLAAGAAVEDPNVQAHGASSRFDISHRGLFGIGAGLALEAAAEAIGLSLERAALGRDGALAVFDSPCQTADPWVFISGPPTQLPEFCQRYGRAEQGPGRKKCSRRGPRRA